MKDNKPPKKAVKVSPKKVSATTEETAAKTTKSEAKADAKAPAKAKKAAKAAAPEMPSVLLEGDAPTRTTASGPGQRYALGPSTPPAHFGSVDDLGELPEAYGTGRLFLTARDPHWVYAHWDLTREQLQKYNALSTDRHLIVRVYLNAVGGQVVTEVHVHPESRNWFVHVGRGGSRFAGELGYYDSKGKWTVVSTSGPTLTPPDFLSDDASVRFATIPVDVPFEQMLEMVKNAAQENLPLVEAIQQLRDSGHKNLPAPERVTAGKWTAAQERALAEVVTMDSVRRVWMGSLEITELIRRQLVQDLSSAAAAQFSAPSSPIGGVSSVSSPFGAVGAPGAKSFWFNVNAELIIYGATEPDAEVSIGGRVIKLRPDGTFSYRFALPDGKYDLPAVAISNDRTDGRSADLKFSRSTEYRGEVGAHPQDPQLKPPLVANVA
jgi:hypothetical protein